MIRSELIATFVHIVDAGSLNAAARRLGLSRSVISDRLNALEADIGASLITRSTHGFSLTRAGEAFLEHARGLVGAMEVARNAVAEAEGSVSGLLRIAVPAALTIRWLAPVFAQFLRDHPRVTLEVSASDRTIDIVQDGFDMAIRGARHPDSALIARKITTGRRIVVCSPAYAEEYGVPRSLADLQNHTCSVYRNRRVTQDWTFRTSKGVRYARPAGRFEADDGSVLVQAAVEGIGVSLLPTFMVADELVSGCLLKVDLGVEPDIDRISAVYPKSNASLPRLRSFVDHVRGAIGDPPPWDVRLAEAGIIELD